MKKFFFLAFFLAISFLFQVKTVRALSQFAGEIISIPAFEIMEVEAMGFQCAKHGTSFSIRPIGSPSGTPVSYFIPSFVSSSTNIIPSLNQKIMGIYFGMATVPCILPATPTPIITVVYLNNVSYFGNSKF